MTPTQHSTSIGRPSATVGLSSLREVVSSGWSLGLVLLAGVLVLTIFEGAARKWLFAGSPALRYAAYFSKDVVFLVAAYMGTQRGKQVDFSWLGFCALLVLLPSAIGTLAHSNVVGVALSVRAYLVVPICAFLAAPLVRNFRDVERVALVVAAASLPVAMLGVVQYRLPAGHILNKYDVATEYGAAGDAGFVRATGTFSYIAGMSTMACLGAWSGVLLATPLPGRKTWVRALGAAALGAGLVCAAVSMSRGAVLGWAIVAAGALMLNLRANLMVTVGLAGAGMAAILLFVNPGESLESLAGKDSIATGVMHRFRHSDKAGDRITTLVTDVLYGVASHPLGEGLGLGQPGGFYASGLKMPGTIESEWGRIAYEVGPLGLIGVLIPRLVAGLILWRGLQGTTDRYRRLVLATALPFLAVNAIGSMAFNHVGNSAAWAVAALSFGAAWPARISSEEMGRRQ